MISDDSDFLLNMKRNSVGETTFLPHIQHDMSLQLPNNYKISKSRNLSDKKNDIKVYKKYQPQKIKNPFEMNEDDQNNFQNIRKRTQLNLNIGIKNFSRKDIYDTKNGSVDKSVKNL